MQQLNAVGVLLGLYVSTGPGCQTSCVSQRRLERPPRLIISTTSSCRSPKNETAPFAPNRKTLQPIAEASLSQRWRLLEAFGLSRFGCNGGYGFQATQLFNGQSLRIRNSTVQGSGLGFCEPSALRYGSRAHITRTTPG